MLEDDKCYGQKLERSAGDGWSGVAILNWVVRGGLPESWHQSKYLK